jgi:hypothetical protein
MAVEKAADAAKILLRLGKRFGTFIGLAVRSKGVHD